MYFFSNLIAYILLASNLKRVTSFKNDVTLKKRDFKVINQLKLNLARFYHCSPTVNRPC